MPMKHKSIKAAEQELNVMKPSKVRLLIVHLDGKKQV